MRRGPFMEENLLKRSSLLGKSFFDGAMFLSAHETLHADLEANPTEGGRTVVTRINSTRWAREEVDR